ncbi:MAG: hypothetical protein NPIRA02_39530 [Nitrospirales bacterium]|nr:MAG: hypothetical protein NPIRA02_39530 [Nitrospirales bacterium]
MNWRHTVIHAHAAPKITAASMKVALGLPLIFMMCNLNSIQAEETHHPEDMSYVPFGTYAMGIEKKARTMAEHAGESPTLYEKRLSLPWSREAFHDEGPVHWVVTDAYLIDKYEVSNDKFEKFMKATGHPSPAYWDDPRLNKPEQPVVGVNYLDATAYCKWEGKRLPTEAEWERAARGPEGRKYPWGNELDPSKANYGKRHSATLPVDSLPEGASAYGLHHMAGNVFEWVEDWYDPNFYKKTPHPVNTKGPSKPIWLGGTGTYVDRLTTGAKRVIRGGSWIAAEASITTTHRFWNNPMNNSYGVGLGFRCAKSASQTVIDEVRSLTINAMKHMGEEKFDEAKVDIGKALQLDPTNEELTQIRSLLY